MKRLLFLFFFSICFATGLSAQTKMIAFKSHSGSMKNFKKGFKHADFDLNFHNLGMAPQPTIENAEIDSVIFISDSLAVMVTSNVCKNSPWYYGYDSTVDYESKLLWSKGRDTVVNHPLFSQQHSLDSIKTELKERYNFKNDIEKTVFVGFDNGEEDGSKNEEIAPVIEEDSTPKNGPGLFIFFISLIALFIGLISWRLSVIKQSQSVKSI